MQHIGKAIRYARESEGLSPTELARKAKVAVSTVTAIEGGDQSPSLKTTTVIATALGLSAVHLMMIAEQLQKHKAEFDALEKAEKELIDSALAILSKEKPRKKTVQA
jgi:transcriptional regulator with XRE-family HTH domain